LKIQTLGSATRQIAAAGLPHNDCFPADELRIWALQNGPLSSGAVGLPQVRLSFRIQGRVNARNKWERRKRSIAA
jgi:hypothetical protein